MDPEPTQSIEKVTQTGEEPAQSWKPAPVDFGNVVLKEYEATPPNPTLLTGNCFMDCINQALDVLFFGRDVEQHKGATATFDMIEAQQHSRPTAERECEGGTDYMAFLRGVCLCPEIVRSFPPLPTATPLGRFHDSDPFTREVLGHFCKDEPETYLPYMHFHHALPHHYTYVLAEGPPQVPGWSATQH